MLEITHYLKSHEFGVACLWHQVRCKHIKVPMLCQKQKDLPALGPPLHDPEVHFINGAKCSPDTS